MGFYEYLPPGYDDGAPRPLLVAVHGTYENGDGSTELFKLLANGPVMLASQDRWPASRPFVVLAPQHPGRLCTTSAELDRFLGWALASYRIDPRRVYLTGLSCGSIAVWSYLGDHGGKVVAAALLLAGDPGSPDRSWSAWGLRGCGLREVAIWAVHGTADSVVTISRERETMAKLAGCPAPPGRELVWTERPGDGHDVWTAVYSGLSGEDPYAWLLENPKP
jgi:predicted peptidase